MAPSTRRLAVLLGILKSASAYVPLDPALPAERLEYMAADAGVLVVVADEAGAQVLGQTQLAAEVVSIDAEWEQIALLDSWNPKLPVQPSSAAYVIYTSGSTGRPKGVVVEHRQVVNHALGMAEQWLVGPADRVLQFASLTFDVSVMDMFTALLSGARAVVASNEVRLSPSGLAALMRDREVTLACLPPAVLNLLTGEQFPRLRMLMAAGEEFPVELERAWLRPGLRLVNGYGPTEDTVIATFAELDGSVVPPPIGLPAANQQAYVLDRSLNPVPVGVVGELYLGGAGVARGYLNAPELTRERFIPDPFRGGEVPGARLYKTGDRVRRLPDGNIVFLGRFDSQVKINGGLRVELGDVETALTAYPAVAQALVTVAENAAEGKHLVGYVRPVPWGPGSTLDLADLRRHLARQLPAYMIPPHLAVVEAFPLNASGKIDRSALPAPAPTQADGAVDGEAPGTLLETALADMYAGLLGRDRVGAEDAFFDVGGTSLLAMRLVVLLQEELAVDMAVASVFRAPSPRDLAAVLRDEHGIKDEDLGPDGLEGLCDEETAAVLSAHDSALGTAVDE
jgi:amino acid adenylation domain-containing protein